MQVFVAFAGLSTGGPGEADGVSAPVREGFARVEARYAPRWSAPPRRREAVSASAGMALWEREPVSLWPSWAVDRATSVASLYAPVGYERLIAATPLADAPLRLAAELARRPASIEALCPPFVCAALDSSADELRLCTDAVGVGRLFEARTPWGWVWSNRPEAALAFAGLPARADEVAWAHIAVADEVFGQVSAYAGVRVVDAATSVHWDGRAGRLTASAVDVVASWATADPAARGGELIEAAAQELAGVAASVPRLFAGEPVVDLTGGRDSRLVAAAFVAAGGPVRLHTHDALPGDLQVARELVAALGESAPVEHLVEHVATGGVAAPRPWRAMERARAWHAFAEGTRPYSYLHYPAPEHIDGPRPVAIGGAGGEVAHGYFYPPGWEELQRLAATQMIAAFTDRVVARLAPVAGAHPDAREVVRAQIAATLGEIHGRGYRDATLLDVFYVRERVRRWGATGERPGVISPLLAPSFLRAALSLTPAQRAGHTLHRELTRALVPAWADAPYYPAEYAGPAAAGRPRPAAPLVVRLGDAADSAAVNALVRDPQVWSAAFDPGVVARLWDRSVQGCTDARQERIVRAVVWRGAFADHLADLDGTSCPRPPVPWVAPAAEPIEPVAVTAVPGVANAVPGRPTTSPRVDGATRLARRVARTGVWRVCRDTPVGGLVRAAWARRRG